MGVINNKKNRANTEVSQEGGTVYAAGTPMKELELAALSCFFGEPTFYRKGVEDSHFRISNDSVLPREWGNLTTSQVMEIVIDAALDHDIEETLKFAVSVRNDYHFRTTPQVILVRAAMHKNAHGTDLISRYAPKIMIRMDEPMVQAAYWAHVYGNGSLRTRLPSRLKRAWEKRLRTASEYELAKYRMEGREVNIYDIVNLTHANSPAIDKLMNGNLKLGEDDRVTWESIISGGGKWSDAVNVMGHMALLRNLRNLEQNNACGPDVLKKLIEGAKNGKQMPFRYLSAYNSVSSPKIKDAIEECLEISVGNLPFVGDRVASIVDGSGSMGGTLTSSMGSMSMLEIAALMGSLTARAAGGSTTTVFGETNVDIQLRGKSSIFDNAKEIRYQRVGHATNLAPVIERYIRKNMQFDSIFIYSDMELMDSYYSAYDLMKKYRREVNPKAQFFTVNLAGNVRTLAPVMYDGVTALSGWSDRIFDFANRVIG